MTLHCFKCQTKQPIAAARDVGFRDTCVQCGSDLHVCANCIHYDASSYNHCKEPLAERVLEIDRGNVCEYFRYREGRDHLKATSTSPGSRIKKLDDLFKK